MSGKILERTHSGHKTEKGGYDLYRNPLKSLVELDRIELTTS